MTPKPMPLGSTIKDLYDETWALSLRGRIRIASHEAACVGFLATSSWLLACMPAEVQLGSWSMSDGIGSSLVDRLYLALKNIAPVPLSVLAVLLAGFAWMGIERVSVDCFYKDCPPSAALFSEKYADPTVVNARTKSATAVMLILLGAGAAVSLSPGGVLWGCPRERLAHIGACLCLSLGTALVTFVVTMRALCSRATYIDGYDLMVPEPGADYDYMTRLYADHASGIGRLTGCAFVLLSTAALLSSIPEDLGTIRLWYDVFLESSLLAPGYIRIVWATKTLRGILPVPLGALGAIKLATALIRQCRFAFEWPIYDVPPYPEALAIRKEATLTRAVALGVVCIVLSCCNELADGIVASIPMSGYASVMLALTRSVFLELLTGCVVARLVECLLVSKPFYNSSHVLSLFANEYDKVIAALDFLRVARRMTFALVTLSLTASSLSLMALLSCRQVACWGDLVGVLIGAAAAA